MECLWAYIDDKQMVQISNIFKSLCEFRRKFPDTSSLFKGMKVVLKTTFDCNFQTQHVLCDIL